MASRFVKEIQGYRARATLHEVDGLYYLILSYSGSTAIQRLDITETLAYEADANGKITNSVPVLASKKLEDHHKFTEKLTHDLLALHRRVEQTT